MRKDKDGKTRKEKRLDLAVNAGLGTGLVGGGLYLAGKAYERLGDPRKKNGGVLMKDVKELSGPVKKVGLGAMAAGLGLAGIAKYQHHKYKKKQDAYKKDK